MPVEPLVCPCFPNPAGSTPPPAIFLFKAATRFVIFPGSGGVKTRIEDAEPRLGGESIADVLRSVGGIIRDSWCGPCFGQGEVMLNPGERAITSFNRGSYGVQ